MAKQEKKALTKDRLIGMQVIDAEANNVGTVIDIAFTIGKVGQTMIIETKKGESKEINWDDIQAAGDFVLLKPSAGQTQASGAQSMTQQPVAQQTQQAQTPTCPTCGGPLTWIPQYSRWYCYKDKKYI